MNWVGGWEPRGATAGLLMGKVFCCDYGNGRARAIAHRSLLSSDSQPLANRLVYTAPRQREHRRTSRRPVQGIRSRRVAVYVFWVVVGVLVFASRSAGQHSTHQTSASARLPLVKDLGSVKGRRNPTPPSALPRASAAALRTCRTRCCCGVKAALRTKPGWAGYPAISQGLSLSCFWL